MWLCNSQNYWWQPGRASWAPLASPGKGEGFNNLPTDLQVMGHVRCGARHRADGGSQRPCM